MMMMRRKKMEKAMKMTEQRRANQMLLKVEMVGKGNFVPLQDSSDGLHNQLVNKHPRDNLNKKVVGVPSRKVDVKAKCQ